VGDGNFSDYIEGVSTLFTSIPLSIFQYGLPKGSDFVDFPGYLNQDRMAYQPELKPDLSALDSYVPYAISAEAFLLRKFKALPASHPPLIVPLPEKALPPVPVPQDLR
jgi:hypothetical protein